MELGVDREDVRQNTQADSQQNPSLSPAASDYDLSKESLPKTTSRNSRSTNKESLPLFFEDKLGLYPVISSPRRNQPAYRNFQEALVVQETVTVFEKWLDFTADKISNNSRESGKTSGNGNGNGHSKSLAGFATNSEPGPLRLDPLASLELPVEIKRGWSRFALPTLYLGTLFGDTHSPILPARANEQLRNRLSAKKILILGDPDETWGRILRRFACSVTTFKHQVPQEQSSGTALLNGNGKLGGSKFDHHNLWNVLDPNSEIRKALAGEKFDAIVSDGFFKPGSHFEVLPREIEHRLQVPKGLTVSTNVPFHLALWLIESNFLMQPGGFQLHCDLDPKPICDDYRYVSPFLRTRTFGEFREVEQDFPNLSSMFVVSDGKRGGNFLRE